VLDFCRLALASIAHDITSMTAGASLEEIGMDVDRVHVAGAYELTAISPGSRVAPSTVGRLVNALPAVAAAPPGVHTAFAPRLPPARSRALGVSSERSSAGGPFIE
jgi:hypothetical protein